MRVVRWKPAQTQDHGIVAKWVICLTHMRVEIADVKRVVVVLWLRRVISQFVNITVHHKRKKVSPPAQLWVLQERNWIASPSQGAPPSSGGYKGATATGSLPHTSRCTPPNPSSCPTPRPLQRKTFSSLSSLHQSHPSLKTRFFRRMRLEWFYDNLRNTRKSQLVFYYQMHVVISSTYQPSILVCTKYTSRDLPYRDLQESKALLNIS